MDRRFILVVMMLIMANVANVDARGVSWDAPLTPSDSVFMEQIWNTTPLSMNVDKSADGSFWIGVDGAMLIKSGESVTAIWGIRNPENAAYYASYQIITDNFPQKTQAFTDAVNSTELKVRLVENPYKAQGYWFFFEQELAYNGTIESIEGPVAAMRGHLMQVSENTVFRDLQPSHDWFWDSNREWTGSGWSG